MSSNRTIAAPRHVSLAKYDPSDTEGLTKDEGDARLTELHQRLTDLQALLYGAGRQSVLIVLQGLDTAGKDGTIKHVMAQLNPIGCRVASFKAPTEEELRHDFLWRVHQQTPAHGMMAIFNRSHYEDVLVARVQQLVAPDEWRARYAEINDFERMLARSGTMLLKFFLHISKDEQRKRLLAREQDPAKAWKLSVEDWKDRQHWDAYLAAYEDALGRCGTEWAPWHIVPANHKWYRNYVVARTIVEQLATREHAWKDELEARGKVALATLREAHVHEDEQ
ncbi:MAG TPA: PPK2 family polyphosphate kinase [Ktedonobacterales bacterium]|nr:PPK2 family polyphosphate kinase [Ktedonobacterales bacterium]